MTIVVAVADSPEGKAALDAAVTEAERFDSDVVAVNLGLRALDVDGVSDKVAIRVVESSERDDRDPAELVLGEIARSGANRLVVGFKKRSAVGKALLGSVAQRLILDAPVPVLGVKAPE